MLLVWTEEKSPNLGESCITALTCVYWNISSLHGREGVQVCIYCAEVCTHRKLAFAIFALTQKAFHLKATAFAQAQSLTSWWRHSCVVIVCSHWQKEPWRGVAACTDPQHSTTLPGWYVSCCLLVMHVNFQRSKLWSTYNISTDAVTTALWHVMQQ